MPNLLEWVGTDVLETWFLGKVAILAIPSRRHTKVKAHWRKVRKVTWMFQLWVNLQTASQAPMLAAPIPATRYAPEIPRMDDLIPMRSVPNPTPAIATARRENRIQVLQSLLDEQIRRFCLFRSFWTRNQAKRHCKRSRSNSISDFAAFNSNLDVVHSNHEDRIPGTHRCTNGTWSYISILRFMLRSQDMINETLSRGSKQNRDSA